MGGLGSGPRYATGHRAPAFRPGRRRNSAIRSWRASRVLPLAALLLALVAGAPPAAAESKARVAVEVDGIKGDLKRNVLNTLSIAQKGSFPESEIRSRHEKAVPEIHRALQPFGYYEPSITSELTPKHGDFIAHYTIDPGPPLKIDSVSVTVSGDGAQDPAFVGLRVGFPLRKGDVLNQPLYDDAKKNFIKAAMNHGYLDGRFAAHDLIVDLNRYVASIVLDYDTGPQYRFGAVEFHQDVLKPELLQGYITFKQGDPIDFTKLLELESSLGKSPYFSRVEVMPDRRRPGPDNQLPIVVDLIPAKPQKYTMGAGYGTDNGAHVRGTAELRRINRRGHRGEVDGLLSKTEQTGAVKYVMPWPYPRSDVLTASSGYTAQEYSTSTDQTGFAGLGLSRMWAGWEENFNLNFRRERWSVGVDGGLDNFLVPDASWSRLRTNDPVTPTDGSRLRFLGAAASHALFSAASYQRLGAEARWMKTFVRHHQLEAHLQGGYTWTDEFRRLPPTARFFAGGSESVRGFGYNSLGARDSLGNVIGGRALAIASVEYTYLFNRTWGLATFYDAGNAMMSFRDPLQRGTGFGIRWMSPVGVVRVDLGFPLTTPKHNPQVHLAIGPGL